MTKNTNYTSEAMSFISKLKEKAPELKLNANMLRKTWWDKADAEVSEERGLNANNLKPKGYYYF